MTVSLVSDNTITVLGSATLTSNGTADLSVAATTLPPNLQVGNYQLIETYTDVAGGQFAGSTADGTLSITTASTTVVPGNASVNFYGSTASPVFTVAVGVNSPAGTVTTGNVAVSLASGNTTTSLGTAAVSSNGTATVSVAANTLPANLQTGPYQLVETDTDVAGGQFAGSTADGTLTITTAPTIVVPGNGSVAFGTTSSFTIPVAVDSPAGTVTGNVTISLISDNTSTLLTPATGVALSGGKSSVSVTLPAGLSTGIYQLVETYLGNGQFASSTANGTLTITTASTMLIPGNAVISTSGGITTVPVVVNSPAGLVNVGTVTISLVNGGTTTVVGSAPVSGGSASVPASFPANLPPGNYQLIETYSDSTGHFNGSSALGTLTVNPVPPPPSPPVVPPQVAALEVAIDIAALALQGDPPALLELQLFSQLILDKSVPGTIPELIGGIQSLYPLTDGLGFAAITSGMYIAESLEHS